jgi:hypothetical protein
MQWITYYSPFRPMLPRVPIGPFFFGELARPTERVNSANATFMS